MEMKLSENIRTQRKARGLTQEQLAEVLGVTVGAVHKWEVGLSTPELPLIVEMADFFDTSVDALLGYALKDNRLKAVEGRLWQYHKEKNREGLAEVEKALKKYPNAFGIAHAGATLYHGIGMEAKDPAMLRRALELYEMARLLLPQNRDTAISDQTLCASIGAVYFALGEREKGLQLLMEQNADDLYSALIGTVLANEMGRPEEALPYLSKGMIRIVYELIYAVMGYAKLYAGRRDPKSGIALLEWGIQTLQGLKASNAPDYLDKICAVFFAHLAGFQLDSGDRSASARSLRHAVDLSRRFDAAPDTSTLNLRFILEGDNPFYDQLGMTAAEAVENTLRGIGSDALWTILRELSGNGEEGC